MQLNYRGTQYQKHFPPIDIVEGELGGKYRGQTWKIHYPRHMQMTQPSHELKYRSIAYSTGETPEHLKEPVVPALTIHQPVPNNLTRTHTANICRILEHRRQVAEAQGDQQLLRMLELEAQQVVC